MSDDKSNKAGGWFGNPLPIMMVVMLAAGVLVKHIPLESARPTDPERVKFVPTSQQDVEARLWQDPFAAVEKHEKNLDPAAPFAAHNPDRLHTRIQALLHDPDPNRLTVVAVSVFGGSFDEAAESRRRTRFAVVSALGFHGYSPEHADAIGYFRITGSEPNAVKLTVPYEWFERRNPSSDVLVLWLNEEKLSTTTPINGLHHLFNELTPTDQAEGLRVKLIGPAGSAMLIDLVRKNTDPKHKLIALKSGSTIEVFSPSATISDCDLLTPVDKRGNQKPWDCFTKSPDLPDDLKALPIIRTTGTDDVLSAALLWELWQRGLNRDSWWERIRAIFVKDPGDPSFLRKCEDGLVLIGERDTEYGRTLSRYLKNGFSERCGATAPPPVRTFTYLRGLDGVLPDLDKSGSKTPSKNDSGKSKDLRAQLDDAPPEHAEGRSQFDYLRRLADEIDRLDHDKKSFAENGVKAIGIVGSDLYDKLLILQALRGRFKDKIFFTTDLDARYLHADQKDWARNLVVASNFGLSLRPALQHSTLPFRDSYQAATYLAALMALENQPLDHWRGKMKNWLRPQIYEIGRTEAVHLASPSVPDLAGWITGTNPESITPPATDTKCDDDWVRCENIEPARPSRSLTLELPAILFMLCLGILSVALASRHAQETVRATYGALTSPEHAERQAAQFGMIGIATLVLAMVATVAVVNRAMDASLAQGASEPFVWLEGVSVWPSLLVRFIGFVTMLALALTFMIWIRRQMHQISERFEFPLPQTWRLARSWWSAVRTGPHLDLVSFDREGNADQKPAGASIETVTLWQNYLRATRWHEMAGWILSSMLLVGGLGFAAFSVFGRGSFPHRGQLVETLHYMLVLLNGPVLWLVIFWVGYETRACARFIETLSNAQSVWPTRLLDREEAATGVPRAHLDDYLDFQLILLATQRIHWLIYLPFVAILFMMLSRSDLFDAMDFPLALIFVTGLALAYALYSAVLLRRSAESARAKALEHYETRLLTQARATDSPPPAAADRAAAGPARPPISAEQIKILMERIRSTREGAFAPIAQQPALQALLLPFGGYGSVQLIEYLINLKV